MEAGAGTGAVSCRIPMVFGSVPLQPARAMTRTYRYWAGQKPSSNGVQFSALAGGGAAHCCQEAVFMPALGATNGFTYAAVQASDGSWGSFARLPGAVAFSSITSLIIPSGIRNPDNGNTSYYYLLGLGPSDRLPYFSSLDFISQCGTPELPAYCSGWLWRGQLPVPNGVQFSSLAAGIGNSDQPQVIGLGATDRLPYLIYQTQPFANWYWHGLLPGPSVPFSAVATGSGNGGSLQVIFLGANDGLPYQIYQTTSGNWIWGGQLPDP